ncbi:uncharacterized protein K452DRAFT_77333 [Aplosporella prunicola CBS 121167]|uniref:Uncharacterized protein n=1 Tax=Aplosporella prunicola CBS 121167 TaxID=1176127 RepID=A0A6A6B894_9PEZI|nr:uncharacterized protein K452DRAFT_77333 [Aplosporella prunicola CBS 121167]KAF2139424.1 hypothetical protein K452DRAFT_77333 [Aplosporella prunicola CBS 121167]
MTLGIDLDLSGRQSHDNRHQQYCSSSVPPISRSSSPLSALVRPSVLSDWSYRLLPLVALESALFLSYAAYGFVMLCSAQLAIAWVLDEGRGSDGWLVLVLVPGGVGGCSGALWGWGLRGWVVRGVSESFFAFLSGDAGIARISSALRG